MMFGRAKLFGAKDALYKHHPLLGLSFSIMSGDPVKYRARECTALKSHSLGERIPNWKNCMVHAFVGFGRAIVPTHVMLLARPLQVCSPMPFTDCRSCSEGSRSNRLRRSSYGSKRKCIIIAFFLGIGFIPWTHPCGDRRRFWS